MKGGHGRIPADVDLIRVCAAGHSAIAHGMEDNGRIEAGTSIERTLLLTGQVQHNVVGDGRIDFVIRIRGQHVAALGFIQTEKVAVFDITAACDVLQGILCEELL